MEPHHTQRRWTVANREMYTTDSARNADAPGFHLRINYAFLQPPSTALQPDVPYDNKEFTLSPSLEETISKLLDYSPL
jgi:hypothetical protein